MTRIICADCKQQVEPGMCNACGLLAADCAGNKIGLNRRPAHVFRPQRCKCSPNSTSYNYIVTSDNDITVNIAVSISDDGIILPVAETEWDVL